jgi:hypothetical protein
MSRQKHGKTPLEVDSLQDKDTEDLARWLTDGKVSPQLEQNNNPNNEVPHLPLYYFPAVHSL